MLRLAALIFSATLPVFAQAQAAADPSCFTPGKSFDQRLLGNWEIARWQVRYSTFRRGSEICVLARDASRSEWYYIPELQWDGKTLSAAFVLPSTKWRTESRLTALDANRVQDSYRYPGGERTDIWTRRN